MVLRHPGLHLINAGLRVSIEDEARFAEASCDGHRHRGSSCRLALRQDQGPIRIAYVPFGPLCVAGLRRLVQRIPGWNGSVFGLPIFWAPAATCHPTFQGDIQGRPVNPGLPTRNDLGYHRAPSFTGSLTMVQWAGW